MSSSKVNISNMNSLETSLDKIAENILYLDGKAKATSNEIVGRARAKPITVESLEYYYRVYKYK